MKPRKSNFVPFANEADVLEVGKLTIENRLDRITLAGEIDLTADQQGLAAARVLSALLGEVVARLEAQELPERLATPEASRVDNPFAPR
jgi:hypothetical protein